MKAQWNDTGSAFHPASAPDFLPRRELERLQLGRLQAVVARAHERVDLFRKRMADRVAFVNSRVTELGGADKLPPDALAALEEVLTRLG